MRRMLKRSRRTPPVVSVPDLTPAPSLLAGFGSVLDIGGTRERFGLFLDGAFGDALALHHDWSTVGSDLWVGYNMTCKTPDVPAGSDSDEVEIATIDRALGA